MMRAQVLLPIAISLALLQAAGCAPPHQPDDAGRSGDQRDAEFQDLRDRIPGSPTPDRLTLLTHHQTRRLRLLEEPVLGVHSSAPDIVTAMLQEGGVLVQAVTSGTAEVALYGARYHASVLVENRFEPAPFAAHVVEVVYGSGAGYGQEAMPGVVLGPPQGRGVSAGSLDVVSLGLEGQITLELGVEVIDGPGADFIVFENPFAGFLEPGQVAASTDGIDFHVFPCTPDPDASGCAGVTSVTAHPDNLLDPTEPSLAGGDPFDLETVGLARARFLRIADVQGLDTGGGMAGFDLDAVAVRHALLTPDLMLQAPATLEVPMGGLRPLRVDLVNPELEIFAVHAWCQPLHPDLVEVTERCDALRGLAPGATTLEVTLGDLSLTVQVTVENATP